MFKQEFIQAVLNRYKFANLEDMYSSVGFGSITAGKVIARMLEEYRKVHKEDDIEKNIRSYSKRKTK